jgi:hypothetical protein
MQRDTKRRLRAATAMACCLSAALAGGWTGTGKAAEVPAAAGAAAEPPQDAVDRLRAEVERQAAGLREELDRAEREQDWGELVRRKLVTDAILAPLHLVRDAMRAAHGPDPGAPVDLLRSLRVEWRAGPVTERWCDAATAASAKDWVRAWTPAPGDSRAYRVRVAAEHWTGDDAPPLAEWEISAQWAEGTPVIEARCTTLLPVTDSRRIAFPLPADGFTVRWDEHGASYVDPAGRTHDERWPAAPIFNNPPDSYAAFDGLRLARSPDDAVVSGTAGSATGDAQAVASGQTGELGRDADDARWDRSVARPDGSVVRRERWLRVDGRVVGIDSVQDARRVVHHAPQGVELVTEVEGSETSRAPHRSSTEVVMPAMRWTLDARAPGRAPARWTLWVDGRRFASAEFETLPSVGNESAGASETPDRSLAADATSVRQLVERAISTRSLPLAQDAMLAIDRLYAEHSLPQAQRDAERRLLAERVSAAGMGELPSTGGGPPDADPTRELPPPDPRTVESMRIAWDVCANEAIACLADAFRKRDPGEDRSAPPMRRALRARLDAIRAMLGTDRAPHLDAALAAPPPDAVAIRRRMKSIVEAAAARESRRAEVVRELLGDELGDARRTTAERRTVDAIVHAATNEYLRWISTPPG